MTDDPYRIATPVASRERVEADEAIAGHDLVLGPLAPLFISPALRSTIERLRADDSDAARIELAAALDEAVTSARLRQQDIDTLPTEHWSPRPNDDQWGPVGVEAGTAPLLADMRALVADIDPNVEVTRQGPRLLARFHIRSSPVIWAIDLGGDLRLRTETQTAIFTASKHTMGVLVPDDTPGLKIRKESITDVALKAVHLRKEVEVGDKAFDSEFFLEGNADFAKAMLTDALKSAFHERAKFGEFAFWLEGSVAELTWTGGIIAGLLTPNTFLSSANVLVETRNALRAIRLLRA